MHALSCARMHARARACVHAHARHGHAYSSSDAQVRGGLYAHVHSTRPTSAPARTCCRAPNVSKHCVRRLGRTISHTERQTD
eukprot:4775569-Pleurochrysis_carterae.AAC.3